MAAGEHLEAEDRARRTMAIAGSIVFFLLTPVTVAGWVPWWISHWTMHPAFRGWIALRFVGVALIVCGLPILVNSFARFALEGSGTPAPRFGTQFLIVSGFYRYVRNPMYCAVIAIIVGQGLLLGSRGILLYAVILWTLVHLFVLFYEEPSLLKSFGAEYYMYRAHVPRWIPRLTPWHGVAGSRRRRRAS